MAGQSLEMQITVDARQATTEIDKFKNNLSSISEIANKPIGSLKDIQEGAQKLQQRLAPTAAAISGVSSALGQVGGEAGKVVAGVGQMAAAFGAGGPWAVAIVGATMLVDEYVKTQQDAKQAEGAWRKALDETTNLMREGTAKQTSNMIQLLKDAQTEIRNFGKTASEVRMMDARESLAVNERTLSILEKNLPGFQKKAEEARRDAGAALAIEGEPALESMRVAKEDALAIIGIYENASKRRQEISGEIAKQKQTLSDLEAATKRLNELEEGKKKGEKQTTTGKKAAEEKPPEFSFNIGQKELGDIVGKAAEAREKMLNDIADRGAAVRIDIAEQEAQSISGIIIGSMGGIDQMAVGAVSTITSGIQQVTTDWITGQEHIAERFGALVMQQAGQSLISSGTKLAGEAVVSALTGAEPVAVAQAGAAAGLIATGIGLGGAAAGLEHIAAGGTIGKKLDKSGERDKGVSPRNYARDKGGGGPLVVNVSYGVGGPLPEDTAREIAKVQRQGARRGGA